MKRHSVGEVEEARGRLKTWIDDRLLVLDNLLSIHVFRIEQNNSLFVFLYL